MLESLAAVRRAWTALGAGDAETRAAYEQESSALNLRNLKIVLPIFLCLHALLLTAIHNAPTPTPEHVAWIAWLGRIEAVFVPLTIGLLIVTHAWRSPRAGLVLGEATATMGILGTALMSANVQRIQPNQNAFTVLLLGVGLILRVRPAVYVTNALGGAAIVGYGIAHFLRDPGFLGVQVVVLATVLALALAMFFGTRFLRLRDVATRRQVERLNASLEERVASQVEKITEHAKEIEQLNEQLNQQVKERSRELSMALARLAEEHQALAPGTVLGGRVEIQARIGEGGMGAVYRARDLVTSGAVAVKVVQAGSVNELDGLYRFLREAQALASLTHPAIVRSFHVDVADDGRLFQIMELVAGETLQAWLDREGPLRVPTAARLGAVLADALANAHAAGVVHRDVKPANVMLTSVSPGIKLLDFGVSKLRDARAAHGRTDGNVIGTPEFLSPEQIGDPANVGDRADVYALGLVLYLSLSGRPPYDTVSARSWLVAHVVQPPESIGAVVKDIDPDVASTVMACLRKAPEERPSAADVARSLAACADRLGCAALESLWRPGSRPPDRPSPEPPITGVQRAETPGRRTLKVMR